jgi:hypothetical protein
MVSILSPIVELAVELSVTMRDRECTDAGALTTLQLLKEYSGHEVNIYEKGDYPGGHTHTVKFGREW